MTETRSFLLKYVGARFEGTRLPLDVLSDLPAFRDLLVSYAADQWRKDHAERERLPRNFEKSISFDLVEIRDGSAMPRIEWERGDDQVQLPDLSSELEILVTTSYDKVLALFDHATGPAALDLTPANIRALKKFGGNLLPNEKIEFPGSQGTDGQVIYLDKYRWESLITRGRDSRPARYDGTGMLIGTGVDPTGANGRIDVHTPEHGTITIPISPERVRADFDGNIEHEVHFRLKIELDNNDALRSVIDVFDVDVIEAKVLSPLTACRERVAYLRTLPEGWHEGFGKPPTLESAATALRLLARKPGMAASYRIFPTDAGGMLFEFVRTGWSHSIEIGPGGTAETYGTEISGDGEMDTDALDVNSDEFFQRFEQITGGRG